jgi:hypothetical protein
MLDVLFNYHKLLASFATFTLVTIEEMKRNEARTYQNSLLIIRPKDANLKRMVEREGTERWRRGSEAEGTVEGSGNRVPAVGSHHEEAVAAHRLL